MLHTDDSFPLARNFVQFGYVTNDIGAAIARLASTAGIRQWRRETGLRQRVQADSHCTVDIALACVGPTMLELVQPVDGDRSLYGAAGKLAERGAIALHHLAYGVPSLSEWQRLLRVVKAQRLRVTQMDAPGLPLRTLCLDLGLGHHNEYLLLDEGGRMHFATVPQNLHGYGGP